MLQFFLFSSILIAIIMFKYEFLKNDFPLLFYINTIPFFYLKPFKIFDFSPSLFHVSSGHVLCIIYLPSNYNRIRNVSFIKQRVLICFLFSNYIKSN
jgi:hypothetical protein